jgi:hypothetical protein
LVREAPIVSEREKSMRRAGAALAALPSAAAHGQTSKRSG